VLGLGWELLLDMLLSLFFVLLMGPEGAVGRPAWTGVVGL
jgi:hypothetical protein